MNFNPATGVLSGTTVSTNIFSLIITASNAQGDTNATLTVNSLGAKTAPVILAGTVDEVTGRSAKINGLLSDTGGVSNTVTI